MPAMHNETLRAKLARLKRERQEALSVPTDWRRERAARSAYDELGREIEKLERILRRCRKVA
jgi:hypothetical protein